ncbi:MAG: ferritin family protein [Candidatus Bipolaricaulis sp.]|nr:ferritin family protein [Candidatus Bipolaricaulis sp.]MDD5220094.1 ferritin family protein [Candidatus Bipolaricaulis sp.]MDD5646890.1 ferritin family protein [Candidatus Bipolaricaulis sp.]
MTHPLRRTLDVAAAGEKELEVLYKRWSQHAPTARTMALLAEMGAAERGHHEMLLHISPAEILPKRVDPRAGDAVLDFLVDVPLPGGELSQDAIAAATRREAALAALYEFLAGLGGEAGPLFRALAAEEQRHDRLLRTEVHAAVDTFPKRGCT